MVLVLAQQVSVSRWSVAWSFYGGGSFLGSLHDSNNIGLAMGDLWIFDSLPRNNPCAEPWTKGEGEAALTRFYYDALQRKCLAFNYFGTKGNQNNFLTRESCETACPVWINPCAIGQPTLTSDQHPFRCHQGAPCSSGYYCHIGFDESTTACCPSQGDPCSLIVKEGRGTQSIQRWFYNQKTRQCQPFTYKGMGGNENNFLLREHCESTCPVWVNACPQGEAYLLPTGRPQQCDPANEDSCPETHWCHPEQFHDEGKLRSAVSSSSESLSTDDELPEQHYGDVNPRLFAVFTNPCKLGEPYASGNRYYTCSPTSLCPKTHYCHVGADANYCCPVLGSDPCSQPLDRGVGSAGLQRWYWNPQAKACMAFSYCGTKGTQNNFLSKQDCERTCYVLDNPCALGQPQMTPDNRPVTCSAGLNTCGAGFWCHIGANQQTTVCCPGRVEGQAICQQPLALGSGDAALPRWYYDPQSMRCVQFFYRGRYGNQNNFLSQQECEQACPDEYQCCPGESTVPGACQGLPEEPGELGAPAPPATRYYYDQAEMRCKEFIYNGRKGNQNNFLTLEDCKQTCNGESA
ncbi:hypothetical protein Aduo_016101 [Ancylostoma duodenale]